MPCGCKIHTGSHEFETSACEKHGKPRVPDLSCPKCGGEDVRINYYDGGSYYGSAHEICKTVVKMKPRDNEQFREHFHRTCQRCHYQWPTDDVLETT